jgi:hypothetical protein
MLDAQCLAAGRSHKEVRRVTGPALNHVRVAVPNRHENVSDGDNLVPIELRTVRNSKIQAEIPNRRPIESNAKNAAIKRPFVGRE